MTTLPPEIRVEAVRDDVTYTFPTRRLGALHWLGLPLVLFSIGWFWIPGHAVHGLLKEFSTGRGGWPLLLFACFFGAFMIPGFMPLGIGLAILCGRARVVWHGQKLSADELVGPFRWRRRLTMGKDSIQKLLVDRSDARANGRLITSGPLADQGSLRVEFARGKPRVLVIGYPHEWLQAVADDLSARAGAQSGSGSKPEVEVIDHSHDDDTPDEAEGALVQPVGSSVQLEETAAGLTLTLPPLGARKGSYGLLHFGIIWCAILGVIVTALIFSMVRGSQSVPWPVFPFLSVFVLIGVFVLVSAVNLGKRRGIIRVLDGTLQIAQEGLFKPKLWNWRREEIATVCAGDSGTRVNNRAIPELQIFPVNGKKVGVFSGRDDANLEWMAAKLRRALKIRCDQP